MSMISKDYAFGRGRTSWWMQQEIMERVEFGWLASLTFEAHCRLISAMVKHMRETGADKEAIEKEVYSRCWY